MAEPSRVKIPVFVPVLIAACAVPECVLTGADLGLWGQHGWRMLAYGYGAFWPGLLGNWQSNYSGQPALMFISYGFLHAGMIHFLTNAVTLLVLGPLLAAHIGAARTLAVYGAALIGGGAGFALLGTGSAPMVGASGALFGLAGALLALDIRRRRAAGLPLSDLRTLIIAIALGNLVIWWATGGELAWETHLGGFLAGWAVLPILVPSGGRPRG